MSLSPSDLRDLISEGKSLQGGSTASAEPVATPRQVGDDSDRRQEGTSTAPAQNHARPASTLQATWIDPEETEFTPVARPGSALAARLFSLLVSCAMLGVLAWLIVPEVDFRIGTANTVTIDDGVLSAQPVPLAPVRPAIVAELYVDSAEQLDVALPAGTAIARLDGRSADGTQRETSEIKVPFDARLASVDTLVGGVTQPGTPVATVYDPSKMYVIVTVDQDSLDLLRRGMTVTLTSQLLADTIEGELVSAVPLLGTDHNPSFTNLVNVRIRPEEDSVADLVPGIHFEARIDLGSVGEDAQPLVVTSEGAGG